MKKVPLISTLVVVAAAGVFAWRDGHRLQVLKIENTRLVMRATALGISLDALIPTASEAGTAGEGPYRESVARLAAAECIGFLEKLDDQEHGSGQDGDEGERRFFEFMGRLAVFDAAQWDIFAAEFISLTKGKNALSPDRLAMLVASLSEIHPATALSFHASVSPLMDEGLRGAINQMVMSSSLGKMAKSDPEAAVRWFREYDAKFPDLVTPDCRAALLAGAAMRRPATAFGLMEELGFKDPGKAVARIVTAAAASDQRNAVLPALHEYLDKVQDGRLKTEIADRACQQLARSAIVDGFEAGSQWADSAGLTAAELESFTEKLTEWVPQGDQGKWMEWLGRKLPEAQAAEKIHRLLQSWAMNDHIAAGEWLKALPEGPTRTAAVSGFSETVAPYEPEAAEQWALTLPAGPVREAALRTILAKWPGRDGIGGTEAAAAFARRNGLN